MFLLFAFIFFAAAAQENSLRYYGNGANDIDRVKIYIDDTLTSLPGPPADMGATDFTIELWIKGILSENTSGSVSCGTNINWIYGNIIFDRDRYLQDRKFGLSVANGNLIWGISGNGTGDYTICGTSNVLDNQWHNIALQRRISDGYMWMFVDGILEAQADGPNGDISYPDNGVPGNYCSGPCNNSDPFIVLGAEKHDAGSLYPSFSGKIDELRISTALRYATTFIPSTAAFMTDSSTAALYHFNEGNGNFISDAVGQSNGFRNYGGTPAGPDWTTDSPFSVTSSAREENSFSFTIFPNPSSEIFSITCSEKISVIEITDIMGKVIQNEIIKMQRVNIDLTKAAKGIYFVRVTGEKGEYAVRKIVLK